MIEKTLVLIKPDGVQRGLIGKIISRFEDVGLKIIAMKLISVDEHLAKSHYPLDEEWAKSLYEKTKKAYDSFGKQMKHKNHMDLGKTIQTWNMRFLREAPVVAMVLEGLHAIELVRKLIGSTEPKSAQPGTIRGDFAHASYSYADAKNICVKNLIHASSSITDAEREINVWFKKSEMYDYKHVHDVHVR